MTATAGDESVTAPGIHDEPPDLSAKYALDQLTRRMRAAAIALPKHLLAEVLYALSGVNIGGIEPFAGLRSWADALEQQAVDAYNNAANAQASADYANAQLTGLLATDVGGGVSLSSGFDGPAGSNIGASFTQVYSGSGGGNWGLSGDGTTKWNKSGGLARTCIARHNTPLATDYQRVRLVIKTIPNPDVGGGGPVNMLCGRINSTCNSYVFVRFSRTAITLGCFVSGSGTVFVTTGAFTPAAGDVYDLYLGTENDDREFITKRNGIVITALTYTDVADVSAMGASNLYPGLGCITTGNVSDQQVPGIVNAWGAIDRQAATH